MDIQGNKLNNQFVTFKLGEEYYGVEIEKVKIIEKVNTYTRVPNAPEYVKGVINLRGEVVPIIDLKKRLNLENNCKCKDSRIVIVDNNDVIVGLIVDSSTEVKNININDIDNPPNVNNNSINQFIYGIGKDNGSLIMLLDLDEILTV